MWKRFNAGNAVRQAIAACQLAEAGVEGAVRPFEGRSGFLSKLAVAPEDVQSLLARLQTARPLTRIGQVTFKRWPVGSRAQSAIQSALQLHQQLKAEGIDPWSLAAVQIDSDQGVYQHLVGSRADPYHPHSRETADHSLPYIVTAALLDGQVKVDAFDPARVCEPRRQAFLAGRVKAQPSAELSQGAAGGFLSRVSVRTSDGREIVGEAKAPPGHRLQPFAAADFDHKLRENVEPLFGAARADEIIRGVRALPQAATLATLAALTRLADAATIDASPAA
jgi:2-methylcitrate dehydratase